MPRTPTPKSSRLYSARISSSLGLAFFIDSSLTLVHLASADDSGDARLFRVAYDQEFGGSGDAKGKEASLTYRVVWIIKCERHGIAEHRSRFLKRDAVLAQIGCGFLYVPIKFHFDGFRATSSRLTSKLSRHGEAQQSGA